MENYLGLFRDNFIRLSIQNKNHPWIIGKLNLHKTLNYGKSVPSIELVSLTSDDLERSF